MVSSTVFVSTGVLVQYKKASKSHRPHICDSFWEECHGLRISLRLSISLLLSFKTLSSTFYLHLAVFFATVAF